MLDPITCYVMSPLTKIAAPSLVIPLDYIILSAIVTFIIQCFLIYCSVPYTGTVDSVFCSKCDTYLWIFVLPEG